MTKEITIEDLARMINNMDQRIDKRFDEVGKDINGIKSDSYDLKEGQRRIEDRLNNVAYKFEIKSIEKRISALES